MRPRHVPRVPHVPQIEETGCGAAALASVLGYFRRAVPLAELSAACDVGRDGVSMATLVKVSAEYGLTATGRRAPQDRHGIRAVLEVPGPAIALMRGGHYVVLDRIDRRGRAVVVDPAGIRTQEDLGTLAERFAGMVLTFAPAEGLLPGERASRGVGRRHREQAESAGTVLRRWWSQEERPVRHLLAGAACCAALSAVAAAAGALTVRDLNRPAVLAWTALAAVSAIVGVGAGRLLGERALTRSSTRRTRRLVAALLTRAPGFYHRRHCGELAARPQRIDSAALTMTQLVADGLGAVIAAVVLVAVCGRLAPSGAVVLLVGSAAAVAVTSAGRRTDHELAAADAATGAARDGEVATDLISLETVMAEASGDQLLARWVAAADRQRGARARVMARAQLRDRVVVSLDAATLATALWVAGPRSTVPVATLLVLAVLGLLLQQRIRYLAQAGVELRSVAAAMRLAQDVEDAPGAGGHPTAPVPAPVVAAVSFESVHYGHQRFRAAVLSGVHLELPAGACVVVTGASGCGKSTLCGLIGGVLMPWSGTVLVEGRPPRLGDPAVRVVPQRPVLVSGTVADNLLLGRAAVDPSRLWEMLRLVELDRVVAARGGLAAVVEEDGRNFSGGERQRLALVRALVDAPHVLVLDEATSNLERPLEDRILARLRATGAALLVVAHRLPSLLDDDQVLRLEGGRLEPARVSTGSAA